MVKAVNKLILEINNTENEYFEKAIFYIRPEKAADNKLNKTAEDYLKAVSRGACITTGRTRKSPVGTIIISIAAALFSATATSVIFILCG